jgi:hypothetical protein
VSQVQERTRARRLGERNKCTNMKSQFLMWKTRTNLCCVVVFPFVPHCLDSNLGLLRTPLAGAEILAKAFFLAGVAARGGGSALGSKVDLVGVTGSSSSFDSLLVTSGARPLFGVGDVGDDARRSATRLCRSALKSIFGLQTSLGEKSGCSGGRSEFGFARTPFGLEGS